MWSAPITFNADGGKGTLAIGQEIEVGTAPLWEVEGRDHIIHGNALSATSGSTAEWSEAPHSQEHSAVRVSFRFEA